MSSHSTRAHTMRYDATQGDLVPDGPAVAKLIMSEKLDKFFDTLAIFELFVCVMFLPYFYIQGLPFSYYIMALAICAFSVVATFGVYSVINSFVEIEFDWPADKNLNIYHDIPLPPPPARTPEDDPACPWGDDSNEDDSTSPDFEIKLNAARRPATRQQSSRVYGLGDIDTIDQIWAKAEAYKPRTSTQIPRTVGLMPPIVTNSQLVHAQAVDHSCSPVAVHQQPFKEQEALLTMYEARPKLLALMDRMEKDAESDGPTAAAYRHRKELADLMNSAPRNALDVPFKYRVIKYAKTHNFDKTARLWSDGIGLTYNGIHLTHDGKVDRAMDTGLWKILRQIEHCKKRALALKRRAEEAKAECEREELRQLLQDVHKHALEFGVKKATEKFSVECYAEWTDELASVIDKVRDQRNEEKRQMEAKLEDIRDIVRTTRDIDGAKKVVGDRVKFLLPANEVQEFWLSLHDELWAEQIAKFRKHSLMQSALFRKIGIEALKEVVFNMNTAQGKSAPPKHTWRIYGHKFNLTEATETYNRYEHVLREIVGKKNARTKFDKIYDNESKQNKAGWRFLMVMTNEVVEEGKTVWYVDYRHGPQVAAACNKIGFPQEEFWIHVRREEAIREERRKQLEEQSKADQAIDEFAELMEQSREQVATASKAQNEARAQADAQAEAAQAAAQSHAEAALSEEEDEFPEEEPISAEEEALMAENRVLVEAELAEEKAHCASHPNRLIKPTKPSRVYTPKPWNADAGGFESYWLHERSKYPEYKKKLVRNNGSWFEFTHAEERKTAQTSTDTEARKEEALAEQVRKDAELVKKVRKDAELAVELRLLNIAARTPLPHDFDEDIPLKPAPAPEEKEVKIWWNPTAFKAPTRTAAPPTGIFDASAFQDLSLSLAQGPTIDPDDEVDISLRPMTRPPRRYAPARGERRARR